MRLPAACTSGKIQTSERDRWKSRMLILGGGPRIRRNGGGGVLFNPLGSHGVRKKHSPKGPSSQESLKGGPAATDGKGRKDDVHTRGNTILTPW